MCWAETHGLGRPYVGLAVGASTLRTVLDSDARLTGQAVAGVKSFLTPWLGFRFEARAYASRAGRESGFMACGSIETIAPRDCRVRDWLVNTDVGGGLVLAF